LNLTITLNKLKLTIGMLLFFLIAVNLTIKFQNFMLLLLPNFQRSFWLYFLSPFLIGSAKVRGYTVTAKDWRKFFLNIIPNGKALLYNLLS